MIGLPLKTYWISFAAFGVVIVEAQTADEAERIAIDTAQSHLPLSQ